MTRLKTKQKFQFIKKLRIKNNLKNLKKNVMNFVLTFKTNLKKRGKFRLKNFSYRSNMNNEGKLQ